MRKTIQVHPDTHDRLRALAALAGVSLSHWLYDLAQRESQHLERALERAREARSLARRAAERSARVAKAKRAKR